MKRGKRCFNQSCSAAAPFASPSNPEVHACEIHKKRDFVNMRNKRCLAPGCYRNPHYGVSRLIDPNSKAQYCTRHKSPGMQNVNGGRCAGPDCSKQPRFSLPGEKGKYCSKHREEGMVDVLYTPCAAEGCRKHPHFGYVEGGPRYCAQHRAEGMVDVKHRRCAVKSCRKDRVLIPGSAMKRGKFCEVHCNVNELMDKEAASSDGTSSDKKRSRVWMTTMDDDKEYMSSESSQRGSSMGDVTSNMSYDYSSSRSDVRPSIYDAAQGLAHLAMLACRERAPPYAGPEPESTMSRGYGHDRDHAPCQHTGHPENFHRDTSRAAAGREPSLPEFDHRAKSNGTRNFFYSAGSSGPERDPYPMFSRDCRDGRDMGQPDAPFEAERPRVSPDLRDGGSCSSNSGGTGAPPSGPAPPFRLRYFEPKPNSSEYSAYPCPWEYTREGRGGRWAEGGSTRGSVPASGWSHSSTS